MGADGAPSFRPAQPERTEVRLYVATMTLIGCSFALGLVALLLFPLLPLLLALIPFWFAAAPGLSEKAQVPARSLALPPRRSAFPRSTEPCPGTSGRTQVRAA
jgi:hypothetical protein